MDRRNLLLGGVGLLGGLWVFSTGSSSEIDTEAVRAEFTERYNAMRRENDLPTVSTDDQLARMAQEHAENMIEYDYTGHVQPDGTDIEDRYQDENLLPQCELPAGPGSVYRGAEVATSVPSSSAGSDEDVAEFALGAWMASSAHREVMVIPEIEAIGLGVAEENGEIRAALKFC